MKLVYKSFGSNDDIRIKKEKQLPDTKGQVTASHHLSLT
jgi:hypothetical protein